LRSQELAVLTALAVVTGSLLADAHLQQARRKVVATANRTRGQGAPGWEAAMGAAFFNNFAYFVMYGTVAYYIAPNMGLEPTLHAAASTLVPALAVAGHARRYF
jgi:hypothetical protein